MQHPTPEALEQEGLPPMSTVLPFFLTAPFAIAVAGMLMIWKSASLFETHWSTATIALTHVVTLGVITMIAVGCLYSMIPALTGRPAPGHRLAPFVFALLALGIVCLVGGLILGVSWPVFVAIATLFPGFALFIVPAYRATRRDASAPCDAGFRLALVSLGLATFLGLWVAHGHGGMRFPGARGLWLEVHIAVALLGWVGSFSYTAYRLCQPDRAKDLSTATIRWVRRCTLFGVVVPSILVLSDYFALIPLDPPRMSLLTSLCIAPAAIATWGIAPIAVLAGLRRVPGEPGESAFWTASFALAPICALLALAVHFSADPRISLGFGWTAVWGWGAMLAHAILRDWIRILAGIDPNRTADVGEGSSATLAFALHCASFVSGAAAIALGSPALTMLTGALLIALAPALASGLWHVRGAKRPR